MVWGSVQGWLRLVSQYIHWFNAKLTRGSRSCCLAGRAKTNHYAMEKNVACASVVEQTKVPTSLLDI